MREGVDLHARNSPSDRDPHSDLPLLSPSQRFQKLDERRAVINRQFEVAPRHRVRLSVVAKDGIGKCIRGAVMHQPGSQSHAPQRRRANLISRAAREFARKTGAKLFLHTTAEVLIGEDNKTVTGAHIVQQEIAEGMELLIGQRRWHGECPAIDRCSSGRSNERAHVARRASDLIEQRRASDGRTGSGPQTIARRRGGGADVSSKVINIVQSEPTLTK